MLPDIKNYAIYPSVVREGQLTEMTIIPCERIHLFADGAEYLLKIIAVNSEESAFYYIPTAQAEIPLTAKDGVLRFTYAFRGEQEYLLRLYQAEKLVSDLSVYALEEDLFSLRPLRGDLHSHSFRSDGACDPSAMAGHFREQGYDFFALTDHNRFYPGGEIDEVFSGVNTDFCRVRGEELHTPISYVHIVHVGGKKSVCAEYLHNRRVYEQEKEEILARVPSHVPEKFKEIYAMAMWATEHIHAVGGLAIFAHPYWTPVPSRCFNACDDLARLLLKSGLFDAYEIIGCMSPSQTNRSLALYNEACAEGHDIPVVGSSDVHGLTRSHSFPHHFTVCFAEENENDAIIAAIKKGFSVAVDAVGDEYERRYAVYGKLRLVSYANFLLAHYFPERTRALAGEGVAMRAYAMGAAPASLIEMTAKMISEEADRFFGRKPPCLPTREILDFEEKWRSVSEKEGPSTRGSLSESING